MDNTNVILCLIGQHKCYPVPDWPACFTCSAEVLSPTFGDKNEDGDNDGDHEDEAGDGDADGETLLRDAKVVRIEFALQKIKIICFKLFYMMIKTQKYCFPMI